LVGRTKVPQGYVGLGNTKNPIMWEGSFWARKKKKYRGENGVRPNLEKGVQVWWLVQRTVLEGMKERKVTKKKLLDILYRWG